MKKLLLIITVISLGIVRLHAQSKTEIEDSLFEQKISYEYLKKQRVVTKRDISDARLTEMLRQSENEKLNREQGLNLVQQIVSLNSKDAAKFTKLSRDLNGSPNKAFDDAVYNYFMLVERAFGEPPLLAMMNKGNRLKLVAISKSSFANIFDWLADFKGCNVLCCDKVDYPHFNYFLFGGSYPNSVSMMKKVEPGIWRDNLICGFNMYNFPITYPIKKAKIRLWPPINIILGILNGTGPAVAFNNNGVFISRIPVLILRGFKINEACKDTESWLLNNRVKAKN